jgi:dTDP-4-amino-4,6-dideoxygalactose transaminase
MSMNTAVPFFRPEIGRAEIDEVVSVLRSGWLTTGAVTERFEEEFAASIGGRHALAVNSCTAALHLAVNALNLRPGEGVLVPTMTFAATAEVVRYEGAVPILVDCDPDTGHLDLDAAQRLLTGAQRCRGVFTSFAGIMPVHVGGHMMDVDAVRRLAESWRLWVVEDAAHAFPAARRSRPHQPWRRCGQGTGDVTCFSFYANKTITTGEGGMAVTDRLDLADRMRLMSLHGLSHDAWTRYASHGRWDYQIVAAGYKYNLTDIAAAIGVHQLERAEKMRARREQIAMRYREAFAAVDEITLPAVPEDCLHSWHLFPILLRLDRLTIDRDQFIEELRRRGVTPSVHWRPLHMHPYYQRTYGYRPNDCPQAAARFARVVSLPIFSAMTPEEIAQVITTVTDVVAANRRGLGRNGAVSRTVSGGATG